MRRDHNFAISSANCVRDITSSKGGLKMSYTEAFRPRATISGPTIPARTHTAIVPRPPAGAPSATRPTMTSRPSSMRPLPTHQHTMMRRLAARPNTVVPRTALSGASRESDFQLFNTFMGSRQFYRWVYNDHWSLDRPTNLLLLVTQNACIGGLNQSETPTRMGLRSGRL